MSNSSAQHQVPKCLTHLSNTKAPSVSNSPVQHQVPKCLTCLSNTKAFDVWPGSCALASLHGKHQRPWRASGQLPCFKMFCTFDPSNHHSWKAILGSFYTKSFVSGVPVLSTFTCWTKDGLRTLALSNTGDADTNQDLKLLLGQFPVCLLKVSQSWICFQNTRCFLYFLIFLLYSVAIFCLPPITQVFCSVEWYQIVSVMILCILAYRVLWCFFPCTLTLAVHTLMFPLGKCWCLCFAIKQSDYLTVLTYGVCCTAGVFLFSCSAGANCPSPLIMIIIAAICIAISHHQGWAHCALQDQQKKIH